MPDGPVAYPLTHSYVHTHNCWEDRAIFLGEWMELTLQLGLVLNSWHSFSLSLPSSGIKGMSHHACRFHRHVDFKMDLVNQTELMAGSVLVLIVLEVAYYNSHGS